MAAIHDAGGQVYGAPCAVRRGWCVQLFFDDLLNMGPGVLNVLDSALGAQRD